MAKQKRNPGKPSVSAATVGYEAQFWQMADALRGSVHQLARARVVGFVLANGSISSNRSGEGEIRKSLIEADNMNCMVALPGEHFCSTQIPPWLWSGRQSDTPRPANDGRLFSTEGNRGVGSFGI